MEREKGKKENLENYEPVSLTSVPRKLMEQILLEDMSKHMKGKKVIWNSPHRLTRGKQCLTNLIAFYDKMDGSMDEGRAAEVFYLDFNKAFDVICHSILIAKLVRYSLNKWTTLQVENCQHKIQMMSV